MKTSHLLLATLLVLITLGAQATGQESSELTTTDSFGMAKAHLEQDGNVSYLNIFYSGFVTGVFSAMAPQCELPDNIKGIELDRVVGQYVISHPERLHLSATVNVKQAINDAYCPKKN